MDARVWSAEVEDDASAWRGVSSRWPLAMGALLRCKFLARGGLASPRALSYMVVSTVSMDEQTMVLHSHAPFGGKDSC